MAPTNPETWTHGPSIIKENELREMAVLLGKGFRVHHPDAVGGISLSYNPNPQKYMVMQYHSVENGFRLPLHGLLRDLCLHFGFAPGQLTANAHKYVASFILRCCALDRAPNLEEFLMLFSIGGFPFYSLYPHNHFPIFEKVELKIDKWSLKYFAIEFPAHSPIDLPGVALRRSISRTKFATADLAEGVYHALKEKEGLISHHSLQDAQLYKKAGFYYPLGPDSIPFEEVPSPERSKVPSTAGSIPAASPSGSRSQGGSTTLVVRDPAAALDVVPLSAIPGLKRPTPSQKWPREGVSGDDFLPKRNKGDSISVSPSPLSTSSGTQNTTPAATSGVLELSHPDRHDCEEEEPRDQSVLRKPITQPQTEVSGSSPHATTSPQVMEEEGMRQKEPESSPTAEREVEVQTETKVSHPEEDETGEQRDVEASLEVREEIEAQQTQEEQREPEERHPATAPRLSISPSGASSRHRLILFLQRVGQTSPMGPATPQSRLDLLALNALHLMEQQSLLTLTEEYLGGASGNFRAVVLLREREMAARALQQKVDSLEQQVQILQGENARLQADSLTELAAERSKVQSLQDQIADYHKETRDLEVQFDRFRAQISILESRVSASEDQVGSLKAELAERESRISALEDSLQDAKRESSRYNEFALKQMEARRLDLEKLKGERQAASELRSKVDEQERMIAAHQEEVAALTARAGALYEEGQFDMQQCIYGAVQSGLPKNRTLDDFISYYGLPLPLPPPASQKRITPISPHRPRGVYLRVPACFLTVPGRKSLLVAQALLVRRRDAIPTQELPGWSLVRGLLLRVPPPLSSCMDSHLRNGGTMTWGEISFHLYAGKRMEPSGIRLLLPYKRRHALNPSLMPYCPPGLTSKGRPDGANGGDAFQSQPIGSVSYLLNVMKGDRWAPSWDRLDGIRGVGFRSPPVGTILVPVNVIKCLRRTLSMPPQLWGPFSVQARKQGKSEGKVIIDLTHSGTSSSSDDDFSTSPAQSNDMAGLSPGEFSRLYPAPRLPAPSPPSPPRLPSGEIDWDSMTLQDFALYQRMCRAKLGRSLLTVEAEPSCESQTASPNLLKPPHNGFPLKGAAPRPGTWEDYDLWETAVSSTCPLSKRKSPWKGPHLLLVDCMDAIGPPSVPSLLQIKSNSFSLFCIKGHSLARSRGFPLIPS
ncbi:unnamed protein product [Cuscuta campestris]|uniref:Uncharacterized protein n=1 Tax=Cuscuta campestris TaxID=132261 RepID=A0A484M3F1_9ASTE|nr:unnamed protein product [Cuscuta campestris]